MTIKEAQQEFAARYRRWALEEAEAEVNDSFPTFCLFKGGTSWKTYQFLRRLNRSEQVLFITGILRGYLADPANARKDPRYDEFRGIDARYSQFGLRQSGLELEVKARRRAGEVIKFVSKRKLQKAMTEAFKKAFGTRCFDHDMDESSSYFQMRVNTWIVQTAFWFGRKESLISYSHSITSEDVIHHPDDPSITGPALALARGLHWIGGFPLKWEYLMDEDVEPACRQVVDLCGRFFAVLPSLLEGLERDKIA